MWRSSHYAVDGRTGTRPIGGVWVWKVAQMIGEQSPTLLLEA